MHLDKIDYAILKQLQKNSQISNQDLAEKVSLSPSPCLRRVKALEKAGFITSYVALLNPEKLDLQFTVMVSVGLNSHDPQIISNFEEKVKSFSEVTQCHLIAGQSQDYLLKVITKNLHAYQNFLMKKLTQVNGVHAVHSSFVLKNIVNSTAIPL